MIDDAGRGRRTRHKSGMEKNVNTIWYLIGNSILLGVGLAMDAFSVCLANAMIEPDMNRRRRAGVAGVYAAFQGIMPLAGWFCVSTLIQVFRILEKIVPWIALILLLFIGTKMLVEGLRGTQEDSTRKLTPALLLVQGIATSIDAISVGLTLVAYDFVRTLTASVIIAVVTFFICLGGLAIGRAIGNRWASKASILGGLILIVIGIEIFVTGLYF